MREAVFADREDAGRRLGERLSALALADPLVLALPRAGVAVAAEVARALQAPLDVLLVRKIGAPFNREFAIGAVVEGQEPEAVVDDAHARRVGATPEWLAQQVRDAGVEIDRRRALYRAGRGLPEVTGRTVVVVDDGIATGATVRAALRALRGRRPARLVLAVPVAPEETLTALRADVDDLVCLGTPADFRAVGEHYLDFHQLDDGEVLDLLAHGPSPRRSTP